MNSANQFSITPIVSGEYKDLGSLFRKLRQEDRALFQGIIDEMYERFVAAVAAGRPKLNEAEVRRLADGRVFTGAKALDSGLIDRIATLREAVDIVAALAGSKQVRLVAYQRGMDYRPNYYASSALRPSGNINLLNIDLQGLQRLTTPQFLYL